VDANEIELRYWAAMAIAREAGAFAAEKYHSRHELKVESKGIQDLVSEADRACEDMIVTALSRLFPQDGFLGEERGARKQGARATWIIDPIDGTANFLRGIPLWCVSLGLVAEDKFVIGVIYNPITEELYAARQGEGATLNGRRIEVSTTKALDQARFGVGLSRRHPTARHTDALKALLDAHCEYSRFGSGALGLALTADGRLDGFWEAHSNVWDVAAGLCIVKEAGGRVNDFLGEDGLRKGNAVLASTPRFYAPLESLLKLEP
jgi:myo-inositol-1(or 4)-monophosphatase